MKKLLLIFFCSSWTFYATSQNLPRIIVLSTGGTIAGQQPNTDRTGYLPGKIPIDELLRTIPSITQKAIVQGEQIASIGSYDMSIAIWLKLARRINEIFAKNEADGTFGKYRTTLDHTISFLKWKFQQSDIGLTGITYSFITDFEFWLKSFQNCNHNSC